MSLSGKMNFLGRSSLPCSPQGRSSGRMPDPVIGSASRQGRPTASPGGALIGRDRPLQCEKVSKATVFVSTRSGWWGGEVEAGRLWEGHLFVGSSPPVFQKRGPPL